MSMHATSDVYQLYLTLVYRVSLYTIAVNLVNQAAFKSIPVMQYLLLRCCHSYFCGLCHQAKQASCCEFSRFSCQLQSLLSHYSIFFSVSDPGGYAC